MPNADMLKVEISQLFLSNVGFVILLDCDGDERSLPIFIGAAEAQSIARFINNINTPRPLTHDLFKNLLDFAEIRLLRVEICDIRDGTFYARLVLEYNAERVEMDCRPSDAIAISLRCEAPIYVSRAIIDDAGHVFRDEDFGDAPRLNGAKHSNPYHPVHPPVHKKSPLENLKARQARAIAEERYEDAARLRDEIRRLENTHTEN